MMNDEQMKEAYRYFIAAVNLYGLFTDADFVDIASHYGVRVTLSDVKSLIAIAKNDVDVCLDFRYHVIADCRLDIVEPKGYAYAKAVLAAQQHKPRYTPGRSVYLRFVNPDHIDPLEPLTAVAEFLYQQRLSPKSSRDLIWEDVLVLHEIVRFDGDFQHFFDYLSSSGYRRLTDLQMQMLIGLLVKVHNQTRMIGNNGFTPNELRHHHSVNSN